MAQTPKSEPGQNSSNVPADTDCRALCEAAYDGFGVRPQRDHRGSSEFVSNAVVKTVLHPALNTVFVGGGETPNLIDEQLVVGMG